LHRPQPWGRLILASPNTWPGSPPPPPRIIFTLAPDFRPRPRIINILWPGVLFGRKPRLTGMFRRVDIALHRLKPLAAGKSLPFAAWWDRREIRVYSITFFLGEEKR
jgi:hypothetical protein